MKEKQTAHEKLIVIDIKLNRGLVVALSCVLAVAALLMFLTLAGGSASASDTEAAQPASTGMRQFYLTSTDNFDGNETLTACAAGYHMASLWEIVDPSNLDYNTDLGYTSGDSGQGPPRTLAWVRTGYVGYTLPDAGRANCAAWTSDSSSHAGSLVQLPLDWTGGDEDVAVWDVLVHGCNFQERVWCIED